MKFRIVYSTDTGARVGWVMCDNRQIAERIARSIIGADTVHGFIVHTVIEEN